jgi:hypothetical protein
MKIPEHLHTFVTGLVYPAFLGAFLFETAQRFLERSVEQYVLVLILIFLFSCDYLYTADPERKDIYNVRRMFLDVVLVLLLYISLRHALALPMLDVSAIWLYLASFKFVSLFWEWAGVPDKHRSFAIVSHFAFLILYGLGWLFFASVIWVLVPVLMLDALTSLFWEYLCQNKILNKMLSKLIFLFTRFLGRRVE